MWVVQYGWCGVVHMGGVVWYMLFGVQCGWYYSRGVVVVDGDAAGEYPMAVRRGTVRVYGYSERAKGVL